MGGEAETGRGGEEWGASGAPPARSARGERGDRATQRRARAGAERRVARRAHAAAWRAQTRRGRDDRHAVRLKAKGDARAGARDGAHAGAAGRRGGHYRKATLERSGAPRAAGDRRTARAPRNAPRECGRTAQRPACASRRARLAARAPRTPTSLPRPMARVDDRGAWDLTTAIPASETDVDYSRRPARVARQPPSEVKDWDTVPYECGARVLRVRAEPPRRGGVTVKARDGDHVGEGADDGPVGVRRSARLPGASTRPGTPGGPSSRVCLRLAARKNAPRPRRGRRSM